MTLPPAIILAGGRATRMGGGDKCLLDLDGRSLLAAIIERLAPQCGAVALNAHGDAARFASFGLQVVPDTVPGLPGPLAGVLAGMEWAASMGAGAVVSVAGDTPFLPRDLVRRLGAAGPGLALAAGRDGGGRVTDHPAFALWPVALRDDLAAYLASGERRVRGFARGQGAATVVWDAGPVDPFFNVNTPGDLEQARTMALQERGRGGRVTIPSP